jgi:hypothetical protein
LTYRGSVGGEENLLRDLIREIHQAVIPVGDFDEAGAFSQPAGFLPARAQTPRTSQKGTLSSRRPIKIVTGIFGGSRSACVPAITSKKRR